MSDPERPRLLLVEDHSVMAKFLTRLLEQRADVQVWAIVASGEEALAWLAQQNEAHFPQLVTVDVSLPDMNGLELMAVIRARYPELPCLMLSAHTDLLYVRKALANGARGYAAKGNPAAIVEAVQSVLRGEIYLTPEMREGLKHLPR